MLSLKKILLRLCLWQHETLSLIYFPLFRISTSPSFVCYRCRRINFACSDNLIGAEQMEIQDCPSKIRHEKCIRHLCNLPNHLFLISSSH